MKFIFLKSAKLALLFSAAISQVSCAENTIDPYFPGLSEGIAVSETCSSYQGDSINLIEKEGNQQFDLYKMLTVKLQKTTIWF